MDYKIVLSRTSPLGKKYADQFLNMHNDLFEGQRALFKELTGEEGFLPISDLSRSWHDNDHAVAAIDNTTLVGFLTFSCSDPYLTIHNFYVAEGWRSKGVGSELFLRAKEFGKKKQCSYLSLNVLENNTKAMGFYKRLGLKTEMVEMAMEI